jgi:hypothetical protein
MLAPTRATALASAALADYRGWLLFIQCTQCGMLQRLPVSELAAEVGGGTLLRGVLPRLRCQRCGEAPGAVKLSDDGGPAAREV